MTSLEPGCTQWDWYSKNLDAIQWYKTEYPFLNEFDMPIHPNILVNYYFDDMKERNLEPVPQMYECYENLFSYFIENYNKDLSDKFQGQSFLDRLLDNISPELGEFFSNIWNNIIIVLILIAVIFYFKNRS